MGGLICGRFIRDSAHANGRYSIDCFDLSAQLMSCARAGQDAPPTGLVGTLWEFYHSRFTIAFAVHSFGGLDLAIQTERVGGAKQQMEC